MHPEEAEAQKKGEFDFEQYVAEHSVHQEKMRELGHFPGEGEYTLSPNQKVPQQQEPKSGEEKEVNIVSADPVNEERGELEGTEESEHDPLPRTSLGASEDEQKEEGSADTPPSVSSTPQQQALPEDTLMEEAKEEDAPLEVERREEDAIAQDEIPEANEQKDPPHTQEPVDLPEDLEEEVKIEEEGEQDKSEDEEVTEGATKEEEQVTSTSTTEEETPVVKEEEQQEVVEETVPENTETDEEASRDEETE